VTKPPARASDQRLWMRILIGVGFALGAAAAVLAYEWIHPLGPMDSRERRKPMIIPQDKPHLTSAVRKAEIEFDAGKRLREIRSKPADLTANIEIKRDEYERSEFYEAWEAAFRRGDLGQRSET
jgi:hypothetical protein